MARARPTETRTAEVARSLQQFADPIQPLAEQLGKAVATQVKHFNARAGRASKPAFPGVAIDDLHELQAQISIVVAKELGRSLASPGAKGKALRMALIAKLAGTEAGGNTELPRIATAASDELLSTAEAAARLEVSRPYVSMLCDQGKLGKVVLTEGGHRRIRSSAVDAYLGSRTRQAASSPSPRAAGVEAGLYDYPDSHFKNVVRVRPEAAKPAKAIAQAARKRRP